MNCFDCVFLALITFIIACLLCFPVTVAQACFLFLLSLFRQAFPRRSDRGRRNRSGSSRREQGSKKRRAVRRRQSRSRLRRSANPPAPRTLNYRVCILRVDDLREHLASFVAINECSVEFEESSLEDLGEAIAALWPGARFVFAARLDYNRSGFGDVRVMLRCNLSNEELRECHQQPPRYLVVLPDRRLINSDGTSSSHLHLDSPAYSAIALLGKGQDRLYFRGHLLPSASSSSSSSSSSASDGNTGNSW